MSTRLASTLQLAALLAFAILCLLALSARANAQDARTFVGGGVQLTRSSNYDPSPEARGDGGSRFVGYWAEAGLGLPAHFQARLLAEYSGTPQLQTIFTTDEGPRRATREIRLR